MLNRCLKYGTGIVLMCAFSLQTLSAATTAYGNNDGKKKKTMVNTSHGLAVKQSKPNMYVRFFNKVYNKYANRPVPYGKELPTLHSKHKPHLYHSK